MKSAALGHQYFAFKSSKAYDPLFGGSRQRNSPRSQPLGSNVNDNRPWTAATEPVPRRTTVSDDSTIPSVAVITRSISDTANPIVFYRSESKDAGKYRACN